MATLAGTALFGPNPGSIAEWNGSGATSYMANADWVRDSTTGRVFRCIVSHTPVLGDKPPSKDPARWQGEDESDIGTTRIQAHMADDGGWLVMSPGRVLMRADHPRLFNKLAPERTNIGITAGSATLRLAGSATQSVTVGDTIEVSGVPAGTVVGSVTIGSSKVGTVDTATGPGLASRIFFRPGVLSSGYAIVPPVEVTGTGLGADTTITATTDDMSGAMASNSGSPNVFGAPSITAFNAAVPGQHATMAGFTGAARVLKADPVVSAANARNVAGDNRIYASSDLYALIDESLLVGRQLTMSGFTGTQTIVAITQPETDVAGTWNWVTGLGLFAPWDLDAAEEAKLMVNRKMSGGPITDAASSHAVTVGPSATRNGSTNNGVASFFWHVGQATFTQPVERLVGNASGAIPASTYVTAHTNDVVANLDSVNGGITLGFAIGAAAQGVVGQYVSHPTGGVTNARVLAVQAEFSAPNTGTTSGSNQLHVQPTVPTSQVRTGQRVSGTGIPANTSITAVGTNLPVDLASTVNGTARLGLPVGTATAPFVVGRKITGTGIPANASIAGTTSAEAAVPGTHAIRDGSTIMRLQPGNGLTATAVGRFVAGAGIPAGTAISLFVADFTAATMRALAATPKLFWPVGGIVTNVGADSKFTLALAWPSGGVIATNPVVQFTVASCGTISGNNNIFLPVGQSQANMSVGQQVTGTGIAAGTAISGLSDEIVVPVAGTINGSSRLNMPVGAPLAGFTVGRKVGGAGIAANASLTAIGAQTTATNVGTLAGSFNLFFPVGAVTTGYTNGRYYDFPGASSSRLNGSPATPVTQPSTFTVTGATNVYWPGGATLQAHAMAGAYITAAGIAAPARIVSTTAAATKTGRTISGNGNIYLQVGEFEAGVTNLIGRGISGAGIPANARIIQQQPEIALASVTTTNGVTTITSPGLFVAAMAGAYINGPGIPANAFIASVTNANTATLSVAAGTGAGTGAATIGGWVTSSANSTSTNNNTTITFTAYVTTDTNATAGALATASLGSYVATTGAATATVPAGGTVTLGAVHTLSAAATVSGETSVTLGGIATMTANATATSAANTVTFAPWANTTTPPAAAQSAGATATFGGVAILSANATANDANIVVTAGPVMTLSANATATSTITDGLLGASHTMSANATSTNAAVAVTFGRWVDISAPATATTSLGAATFGAVSTLSAVATANDNTPLTYGAYVQTASTIAATQRGINNVRAGAVLQVGANAISTNAATATTYGPAVQLSENATASGSNTLTLGGFADHDSTNTAQTIDTTLHFGSTVTMARAVIPGCTYTNVSGDVRNAATPRVIHCPDTSMIVVGEGISGPNIPSGATVTAINSATQFTISEDVTGPQANVTLLQTVAATATNENASGRFFPFGAGDGSTTFGIGIDAAGRALMIGGAGAGMQPVPIGSAVGSERHTMHASQMPPHNHHPKASTAGADNGSWGYINVSTGPQTVATTDTSPGEPNVVARPIAPWDNGSGHPMPLSGPRIAIGKAVAIYAGAM